MGVHNHQDIVHCRIGTRGSALAKRQAQIVRDKLAVLYPNCVFETIAIQTLGDQDKKTPLGSLGGKGVFIKSLEMALLNNEIDIAVHSAKDMTSALHPDLEVSSVLKPESVADLMVFTSGARSLEELPDNAIIATSSLRRKALLSEWRAQISLKDIRGNVETRIQSAKEKGFDAVVLSEAGLIRLGLTDLPVHRYDPTQFIPAPSQGVIAIEHRKSDERMSKLCEAVNDPAQFKLFSLERRILEQIGFDCTVPLGLFSRYSTDNTTYKNKPGIEMHSFISNRCLTQSQRNCITFSQEQGALSVDKLARSLREWLDDYEPG